MRTGSAAVPEETQAVIGKRRASRLAGYQPGGPGQAL